MVTLRNLPRRILLGGLLVGLVLLGAGYAAGHWEGARLAGGTRRPGVARNARPGGLPPWTVAPGCGRGTAAEGPGIGPRLAPGPRGRFRGDGRGEPGTCPEAPPAAGTGGLPAAYNAVSRGAAALALARQNAGNADLSGPQAANDAAETLLARAARQAQSGQTGSAAASARAAALAGRAVADWSSAVWSPSPGFWAGVRNIFRDFSSRPRNAAQAAVADARARVEVAGKLSANAQSGTVDLTKQANAALQAADAAESAGKYTQAARLARAAVELTDASLQSALPPGAPGVTPGRAPRGRGRGGFAATPTPLSTPRATSIPDLSATPTPGASATPVATATP